MSTPIIAPRRRNAVQTPEQALEALRGLCAPWSDDETRLRGILDDLYLAGMRKGVAAATHSPTIPVMTAERYAEVAAFSDPLASL